jgi:hypothetical protein
MLLLFLNVKRLKNKIKMKTKKKINIAASKAITDMVLNKKENIGET